MFSSYLVFLDVSYTYRFKLQSQNIINLMTIFVEEKFCFCLYNHLGVSRESIGGVLVLVQDSGFNDCIICNSVSSNPIHSQKLTPLNPRKIQLTLIGSTSMKCKFKDSRKLVPLSQFCGISGSGSLLAKEQSRTLMGSSSF